MEQDTAITFCRSLSFPDCTQTADLTIGTRQFLVQVIKSEVAAHLAHQARFTVDESRRQSANYLYVPEREVCTGLGTNSVKSLPDRENIELSGQIKFSSVIFPNYMLSSTSVEELLPLQNLAIICGRNFLKELATVLRPYELDLAATPSTRLKAVGWVEFWPWLNRDISARRNDQFLAEDVFLLPCLNQERQRQLIILGAKALGTRDFTGMMDGYGESQKNGREHLLALDRHGLMSGFDLAVSNISKGFEWCSARHLVSLANSVAARARPAMFSLHARKKNHLKQQLCNHLSKLGFKEFNQGLFHISGDSKDVIRNLHRSQRDDLLERKFDFIRRSAPMLLKHFASGHEVNPGKICPRLERIPSGSRLSKIFQFASLTWSVPVSSGFGRRIRYLVWDEQNDKLIGLIAIGDPVINSGVRDRRIGWNIKDRAARLVNIMDAYVLGAVPPYNALLGGKMIACLLRSREVYDDFARLYGRKRGIISKKKKNPRLLVVTTSSSMGRSSVYNRLKLNGVEYLRPIGYTGGWGHFHIPDRLFVELRDYLRTIGHDYADMHEYGDGPSWRLRTTRAALNALGFKDDMLRHGIKRQCFMSLLANNALDILRSGKGKPVLDSLLSVDKIAEAAIDRWMAPRAMNRPEYQSWIPENLMDLFGEPGRLLRSHISEIT